MCKQEMSNPRDSYAVVCLKEEQTVGHLPRKISCLCSLFLGRGGGITATVTGKRQRSIDLPQGGLEIPCCLTFSGPEESITKVRRIMAKLNLMEGDSICTEKELENEEVKESAHSTRLSMVWVCTGRQSLTFEDKQVICNGKRLTDNHLNFSQCLIQAQFPTIGGLTNTLMVNKPCAHWILQNGGLQILFCRDDHWIVASTVGCPLNTVSVYDSVYKDIDVATKGTLVHLLGVPEEDLHINMGQVMQQEGGDDCSVFAAAVLTSLAYGQSEPFQFRQMDMRAHFIECLEKGVLSPFLM